MRDRAVVITGTGVICALGDAPATVWTALMSGASGVRPITQFDAEGGTITHAAEVEHFRARDWVRTRKTLKLMDRKARLAVAAAGQAWVAASLGPPDVSPERLGVYLGALGTEVGVEEMGTALAQAGLDGSVGAGDFSRACMRHVHPYYGLRRLPNMAAFHVAAMVDARGPNNTTITDSAAGLQAIAEAAKWIQAGDADAALAGGSAAPIYPVGVEAYALWAEIAATGAPTADGGPFCAARQGFFLGEGSGMVVLEDGERARARGATPLARIEGSGSTSAPAMPGQVGPLAEAIQRATNIALADAGVPAEAIDGVIACGIGTPAHDLAEAAGLLEALPHQPPITTTKGALGNTLTAAGAIDVAMAVRALAEDRLPPAIAGPASPDLAPNDWVTHEPRRLSLDRMLCLGISLTGAVVAMIVGSTDEGRA